MILKLVSKIGLIFGFLIALVVGMGFILQTQPLEPITHSNMRVLSLLNFQGGSLVDCDRNTSYVPTIREREERPAVTRPSRSGGGFDASGLFDVISWLFILAIAIVGVALLFFFLNRMLGSGAYQQGGRLATATAGDAGDMSPLSSNPLPGAEELAAAGDYRGALRLLYRGILGKLIRLDMLDVEKNRTNWEVLRVLRSRGHRDVHQTLVPVTTLFDKAWYGETEISATEYHEARDATQEIMKSGDPE